MKKDCFLHATFVSEAGSPHCGLFPKEDFHLVGGSTTQRKTWKEEAVQLVQCDWREANRVLTIQAS